MGTLTVPPLARTERILSSSLLPPTKEPRSSIRANRLSPESSPLLRSLTTHMPSRSIMMEREKPSNSVRLRRSPTPRELNPQTAATIVSSPQRSGSMSSTSTILSSYSTTRRPCAS